MQTLLSCSFRVTRWNMIILVMWLPLYQTYWFSVWGSGNRLIFRRRLNQTLDRNQPDTTQARGTVPLPPRGHYQNNDITVVLSMRDIDESVMRFMDRGASRGAVTTGMRTSEWWRWKERCIDRGGRSFRERREKRGKASSSGLAELTVNRRRFIFSGACCSLKGGQIYMPLPGLLWSSAGGARMG